MIRQVQAYGIGAAGLIGAAVTIGRTREVQIVHDQKILVLEHGQIDLGAGHASAITVLDRFQRVRRVLAAPDALVDLERHLASGGRADHGLGVGRLYHLG